MLRAKPRLDKSILGVNRPAIEANGWTFRLDTYPRVRLLLGSPDCRKITSPSELALETRASRFAIQIIDGNMTLFDRTPMAHHGIPVNLTAQSGYKAKLGFWFYALGLDGSLPKTLERTEDSKEFFGHFLSSLRSREPFREALFTTTDREGIVRLDYEKDSLSLPIRIRGHYEKVKPDTRVALVPQRVEDDTVLRVFPDPLGPQLCEFDLDVQQMLPFYTDKHGKAVYLCTLIRRENIQETAIFNWCLRFGGSTRSEGEVMQVLCDEGHVKAVASIRSPLCMPFALSPLQETDSFGRRIISVGFEPKTSGPAIGRRLSLKLHKDAKGRYLVRFGRNPFWISRKTVEDMGLHPGERFEPIAKDGKLCALQSIRTPGLTILFIRNWKWDGKNFYVEHTTSGDVTSDHLDGIRVIEGKTTSVKNGGDSVALGRDGIKIGNSFPGALTPYKVCVVLIEGKTVPYFTKGDGFTQRDWDIASAIANPAAISADPTKASRACVKAEEARNSDNILQTTSLARAEKLYLDAFLANPTESSYLENAMEARRAIIERKRHLERREYYLSLLKTALDNCTPRNIKTAVSNLLSAEDIDDISTAYMLELLLGLAQGVYGKNVQTYQRAIRLLPSVLDERDHRISYNLMGAFRLLLRDRNLSIIPKFVLNNPPAEDRQKAFEDRRAKANNVPRERVRINFQDIARPVAIIETADTISVRVSRLVSEAHNLTDRAEQLKAKALRGEPNLRCERDHVLDDARQLSRQLQTLRRQILEAAFSREDRERFSLRLRSVELRLQGLSI